MDFVRLGESLLAAEWDKHEPIALGVLVVLPLALSIVLYRFAKGRVDAGGSRGLLWASLVPVLIGALMALDPLKAVIDPHYRDFYFLTPRAIALHYASFFVPAASVLLFAGLILYGNYRHRMEG